MQVGSMPDAKTDLLRHTLATLAYRGGRAMLGAPANFAEFRAGGGTRSPGQILSHLGDLLEWSVSIADGKESWSGSEPLDWEKGTARFFASLEALDKRLASATPIACTPEALFQGPIADSFAHVGQIAMLRRLASNPMRSENYFIAEITPGRVGAEQAKPKFEFE
jgi:hypothetical protein